MYCIISTFSQSFDDIGFTYKIPEKLIGILKIGMIVKIIFGKKNTIGLVLEISLNTNFDKLKIKEISDIYCDQIFLYDYQIKLLKWIAEHYFSPIHNSLKTFFPINLIQKIHKNKFVFSDKLETLNYDFLYKKTLNQNQKKIYKEIISSKKNKFLLFGITGSGKTEIYINLIQYYLIKNKQILLLVPEIILTNQIFDRIKEVFGSKILILNSTISPAKKTNYRELIHQNKAKIIVGTRSSIFYPYKDLGLIIVDEEHDNSYISDNSPRYDTIEIVEKICELNNIKILLASGTPKINHMYKALKGDFEVLNLFNEYI